MSSWSLADVAAAVEERSALDTRPARREVLDDKIRTCLELLRRMLPANHWYVQLAHKLVMAGTRAKVVLRQHSAENPDALLPSLDVINASDSEIDLQDKLHHPDGQPLGTRSGTKEDAQRMAMFAPRQWLKTFMVVDSEELETDKRGMPVKVTKAFDMLGIDARSRYQEQCYGPFLDRWAADDPHVPATRMVVRKGRVIVKPKKKTGLHSVARAKPRKVGSTTWWKKFSVLCGANIKKWKTLIHFPSKDDAKSHLKDIGNDLRRLHALWPHLYPALITESYTDGVLELANGSMWETRGSDYVGTTKVGHTGYNLVILSEAGKYERKGGAKAWHDINQAILPAVYNSTRNVIAWEGTNDEQAHELNRVATLSHVDFQFFGWTCLASNVDHPVPSGERETTPAGTYADFEIDEAGEPIPISEADYAATYRLTPEQVGWRRHQIDKLGDLGLVHLEHPISYGESLGLVAGGFFTKIQDSRPPGRIGNLVWRAQPIFRPPTTADKVDFQSSLRGNWHIWDLPPLPDGEEAWYGVGGDFADGMTHSDYAPVGAIRVNDGRVFAISRTRLNPEDSAQEMAKMVSYLGPDRTYTIGELNNQGKLALKEFQKYAHSLWYTQTREAKGYGESREAVWFLQTGGSREPALIAFRIAYHRSLIIIEDERFEWDAEGFVKDKKGKYCAMRLRSPRTGERYMDDLVMLAAMLWELAQWMRKYGMGAAVEVKVAAWPAQTMISALTPKLQRILRRHM